MRKNDAFVAKIVITRLMKGFMAMFAPAESLPSPATLQWEKTMLIIMMQQLSQMLPTPLYNSQARRLYIRREKINNLSSST